MTVVKRAQNCVLMKCCGLKNCKVLHFWTILFQTCYHVSKEIVSVLISKTCFKALCIAYLYKYRKGDVIWLSKRQPFKTIYSCHKAFNYIRFPNYVTSVIQEVAKYANSFILAL